MKNKEYAGLFHDGAIIKIVQKNDVLEITMESAQVLPEWNTEKIPLSKRETISGKLCLEGVKKILENNTNLLSKFQLKRKYDSAGIFDFTFETNKILLIIYWIQYSPKYGESDFFEYEIEAEKIYWQNIPSISDDYWESIEK